MFESILRESHALGVEDPHMDTLNQKGIAFMEDPDSITEEDALEILGSMLEEDDTGIPNRFQMRR